MKVIHVIGGGDVGGAKTHVLSLVGELKKHMEVKLVSLRPGEFADDARAMGIDVAVIRTGNILRDIRKVVALARDGGYDILHSHGAKANLFAVITKLLTGIPTVTTIHSDYRLDYLNNFRKQFTFGLINVVALRDLDYYIGVSRKFKEMLIRRNFDAKRIFTLYNGIDFSEPIREYTREAFSARYGISLRDGDTAVGILARMDPVKDLGTFISAAAIVLKKHPEVKFIIGGDGRERKSLEAQVKSLGVADKISFAGWVDNRDEFFSCIDINVLTSITESFPYVILEGTRLRKATISSDVGGVSDLIQNGENGFIFEPGDVEALAGCIGRLVENPEMRRRMGESIYEEARTNFSLEKLCTTQMEVYDTIYKREEQARGETRKPASGGRHDIIISGWYGYRNVGDDALLKSVISHLRGLDDDLKLLVLTWKPAEISRVYDVDAVNRLNIPKIFMAMRKARLFIYGGGSLIQDSTSTRSLIYYLTIIWLAKRMGLKVMLYANGIEPIKNPLNRMLTRNVVNSVEVITLREEMSVQELKKLSISTPRITITADPAITVEACPAAEADKLLRGEGIVPKGPFVGFSVGKWSGQDRYVPAIAKTADYLAERYGIVPLFLPMKYPDDLYVIDGITANMKKKYRVIRKMYDVNLVAGVIQKMEMLIGMRLHSLVFAASQGVPVIGLVYQMKVEGFLHYINQAGASAGDISQLSFQNLKMLADDVWKRRAEIKGQLLALTPELKQKAVKNARIALDLMEDRLPERASGSSKEIEA